MFWCFAIINGRFGEIFFEKNRGKTYMLGHGYVKKSEYKSAREKKQFEKDTRRYHLTYRNRKYIDQSTRQEIPTKSFKERFRK